MTIITLAICILGLAATTHGFSPALVVTGRVPIAVEARHGALKRPRCHSRIFFSSTTQDEVPASAEWKGEVVSNTPDGVIQGCTIEPRVGSLTEWTVTIDGVEADLGRFSEAVYKKVVSDAKRERFQGFRPGTIPPFLEPTYRIFAMDECARETVLEAMQQNQLRPFDSARSEMKIENVSIPPPSPNGSSSKKRSTKSSSSASGSEAARDAISWRTYDTVKDAIDAGWRPGQSFSFRAGNVKGQKVKDDTDVKGAAPLGSTF
jgi:hypothetical protein